MPGKTLEIVLFVSFFLLGILPFCFSLPSSTNGKWIVDAKTGQRVKLACVNWPSHMETMVAEGLNKKPLKYIVSQIVKQRFNCIRFTWPTFMFTRAEYSNKTVAQSFDALNLAEAKAGIARNNPSLLRMTVVQAHAAVVDALGAQGLMVVLDNHVSKPTWCCSETDGNTFFGDIYFNPDEWLQGLSTVATHYKSKSQVIAIGMRNELRGPLQNATTWYHYITEGTKRVHQANPDLLVFVSGLNYANDLTFLRQKPLPADKKLVYEAHWYPWSWVNISIWEEQPLNKVCPMRVQYFINQTAFMNSGNNPVPLFLGEFGVDERGLSRANDHFISCFLAYATEQDFDWGLWALQGSYYYRQNVTGMEETFGVMDYRWNRIRNPGLQNRLQLIKRKNQDPSLKGSISYVIFHPQSGSCVRTNGKREIYAANCKKLSRWAHDGDGGPIRLLGRGLCLTVKGDGLAPILSTNCSSPQSSWTRLSDSKMHLAARDEKGELMCLHKESPYTSKILTSKCICIEDDPKCQTDSQKDPTIQWFKLVATNV